MKKLQLVRTVVAAINANGDPDLFFCKVACTEQEYSDGKHYNAACNLAMEEGYVPKLEFDEYDPAGKALTQLFVWDSAPIITCS